MTQSTPHTGTVLDSIIAGVIEDMDARKAQTPLRNMQKLAADAAPARNAHEALAGGRNNPAGVGIIAEVKRASPSAWPLANIASPADLAGEYAAGGASAISVLTEQRRFQDRKSTRLNSSHVATSYAVFCFKKKNDEH